MRHKTFVQLPRSDRVSAYLKGGLWHLTGACVQFLAEHARVPGIVAPLLVDEPVQPPDWDNGTSREAVDRRTNGPSEAAGCWEGSEGGESDEERGDCTPAWSPFASEAPAAARRRAAITLVPVFLSAGFGFCSLQHLSIHQADLAALQA